MFAFRELGHNAFSCDIKPCSGGFPEFHIQDDVVNHLYKDWDLVIAHPPCTMLSKVSAVAYSAGYHSFLDIQCARDFFMLFYNLPGRVCIENPVPLSIAKLPKYTQTIQPYEFGDNFTKLTCLWLKNLPPLIPSCYGCTFGNSRNSAPSWVGCNRDATIRSKTFPGIAKAMATQWQF